jgi:hypothetical protein
VKNAMDRLTVRDTSYIRINAPDLTIPITATLKDLIMVSYHNKDLYFVIGENEELKELEVDK